MKNETLSITILLSLLISFTFGYSLMKLDRDTKQQTEPQTKSYTHSVFYQWEKGEQYLIVISLDSETEAFNFGEFKHQKEVLVEGGEYIQTIKFNNLENDIDSYLLEIYQNGELVTMEIGIFD